jgi:hypothetical protein
VKQLRNIGGAILAVILAIMVLGGVQSTTGKSILGPLGQAGTNTWHAIRRLLPSSSLTHNTAGHAGAAALIALAVFAGLVIFVPTLRAGRGLVALAVGAAVLGVLLYQPGLIGA